MFLSVWNSEPDDTHHLENCVALNNQGAISDQDCTEQHSYLCEYTSSKWDFFFIISSINIAANWILRIGVGTGGRGGLGELSHPTFILQS